MALSVIYLFMSLRQLPFTSFFQNIIDAVFNLSWELQGSSDNVQWTALDRQMDSSSLLAKPHVASWPISPPGTVARLDHEASMGGAQIARQRQFSGTDQESQRGNTPHLLTVRFESTKFVLLRFLVVQIADA